MVSIPADYYTRPTSGGLEAIRKIKKRCPDARVLVLTSFSDHEIYFPVIKTGALGFLLKRTSPNLLLSGIHKGYTPLNP
jgi:DNA-binding NarL/FixJ family response regulator